MRSSWKGKFHFFRSSALSPSSYLLPSDLGKKLTLSTGNRSAWVVVKSYMVGKPLRSFVMTKRTGNFHQKKESSSRLRKK